MLHLELTYDEGRLLRELLETALVELRREVAHTDGEELKRALVERRIAIERLLALVSRVHAVL